MNLLKITTLLITVLLAVNAGNTWLQLYMQRDMVSLSRELEKQLALSADKSAQMNDQLDAIADLKKKSQSLSKKVSRIESNIILDIGLPDMSGLDVARRLRRDQVRREHPDAHRPRHGQRPRDRPRCGRRRLRREAVRVPGGRGAAARARPARRARAAPRRSRASTAGAITLDEAARRVTVNGRNVDLSPREFSLLEACCAIPARR